MLELRKKGNKYWLFEDSQIGLFSPSKFTINLELNEIVIVYENGLKSKRYNVSDCEIYDLGELTPFTTSSGDLFMQKLEELNCPCFQKNENIFNITGGNWGEIDGTLSDQTDLQTALDSKLDKVSTSGVERVYTINPDGSQGTKATSDFGVLETKNKLITIPLGDLGVAIEDVTYEMVSDYITNLGIVVEKGENYYFEVIEVPPTYNFDLTSPNWAYEGVTDEASFINWLATRSSEYYADNDLTNIVVTDFNFEGNRIFCNMTADGTIYDLSELGLINADKIGVVNGLTFLNLNNNQIVTFNPTIPLPSSLTALYLGGNQIVTFNPTIALPSSLTELYLKGNQIVIFNPTIALPSSLTYLYLSNNQMTLAGYTESEAWANAQPAFTNPWVVIFGGNIDSITGTNLEAILLTKNCVIIP